MPGLRRISFFSFFTERSSACPPSLQLLPPPRPSRGPMDMKNAGGRRRRPAPERMVAHQGCAANYFAGPGRPRRNISPRPPRGRRASPHRCTNQSSSTSFREDTPPLYKPSLLARCSRRCRHGWPCTGNGTSTAERLGNYCWPAFASAEPTMWPPSEPAGRPLDNRHPRRPGFYYYLPHAPGCWSTLKTITPNIARWGPPTLPLCRLSNH